MQLLKEARFPVVFFANGIGDTLLNLPALRALALLFPQRLTLVCAPGMHALCFAELPLLQAVELQWAENIDTREFDVDRIADSVGRCDVFFSLVPWLTDSLRQLPTRLGAQYTVGYFPDYDLSLLRDYFKHSAELAFDLPRYLDPGLRLEDFAAPPQLPASARSKARALRALLPDDTRVLVVHADTLPEKMWDANAFVGVLHDFLARHPEFTAFVVGQRCQAFEEGRCADRVIICYGLPLAVSLSLVGEADLFLGVDSCMLHAADLFRVPGVGLFGPTAPHEWGFRFGPHRHIWGEGTMAAIDPGTVSVALEDLATGALALA